MSLMQPGGGIRAPLGPVLAATITFVAGLVVWVALSYAGQREPLGALIVREAWDSSLYWTLGIAVFAAAAFAAGFIAPRQIWRWPLCMVAGHALGMVLVHPEGTDLGLLPMAIMFVAIPLAAILLVPAFVGAVLARGRLDPEVGA